MYPIDVVFAGDISWLGRQERFSSLAEVHVISLESTG
jgi:hypothetical protein